jgi:hypothetical protein
MRRAAAVAAAFVLAVTAGVAAAMFIEFPEAPVTRLLANVGKALEKSPDDPHLLYLKGRTHAVAYAQGEDAKAHCDRPPAKPDVAETPGDGALPVFTTREEDRLKFSGAIDEVRSGHLRNGIRCLRRAAELAKAPEVNSPRPDDRPVLLLGLAWLLDDGSRFAPKLGHPEGAEPKDALPDAERTDVDGRIAKLGAEKEDERKAAFDALRKSLPRTWPRLVAQKDAKDEKVRAAVGDLLVRWWQDQALDAYRKAFELTRESDASGSHLSDTFEVSAESARAMLRLLDGAADADAAAREKKAVQAHLDRLAARKGMSITPVVFPVSRATPLAALLPAGRTSRFDLAGDGIERTWPWPSADAAFLVWAPDLAKPIASGRQLFGARTWWIFWRDGYEPLSMLDDDGDGRLSGAELDGIGVWRDLDGDGVSDSGEVVSAAAHGIAWIAVRATRTEDGVLAADRGIGLTDGTTRPTYDWTPASLPEPKSAE